MYNVNCGIPKTLARLLISHMADLESVGEDASFALRDIVDTPVSPELLPLDKNGTLGQITEEIVGPYEVNDFFMYYMLKYGFLPEKILYLANQAFGERYTKTALVTYLKNLYKRFFTQQYKRSSSPDGPKAIEVGLSQRGDWHMPSDASFNLWIKEIETIEDRL
jgi:NAD+ synthase (glutamine-hydrolysing)